MMQMMQSLCFLDLAAGISAILDSFASCSGSTLTLYLSIPICTPPFAWFLHLSQHHTPAETLNSFHSPYEKYQSFSVLKQQTAGIFERHSI
ncbi:hypothetical protein QBC44DRAFT_323980 [Cladorrhinum sp. PSN332]|nr:hypothetical protein QBC44DRAFT_323980 [Cladorrhinum sp. PSN332]